MYTKISSVEFLPGNEQEALDYIREKMFPSASVQAGFKDAFIFQSAAEPQKYTLMSLWESLEKMQSSKLPDHLYAEQQHFETLIATFSQSTHELLFQFSERPEPEE
jgi:heme-degrading monooxygenase HmoA